MPNMLEIWNSEENPVRKEWLYKTLEVFPVLAFVETLIDESQVYKRPGKGFVTDPQHRAKSAEYTGSVVVHGKKVDQMSLTGGLFELDYTDKDKKGFDGEKWVDEQLREKFKTIRYAIKETMMNGNKGLDPKQPNGIKQMIIENQADITASDSDDIIDIPFGTTAGETNTNGRKLSAGSSVADQAKEISTGLDTLLDATLGVPDFLLSDRSIGVQIKGIATGAPNSDLGRRLTYTSEVIPGTKIRIRYAMWDDIPLYFYGWNNKNEKIIGYNETRGTSKKTTSIYAVMTGEDYFKAVIAWATPEYRPTIIGNKDVHSVDYMYLWAVDNQRALARLSGILTEKVEE